MSGEVIGWSLDRVKALQAENEKLKDRINGYEEILQRTVYSIELLRDSDGDLMVRENWLAPNGQSFHRLLWMPSDEIVEFTRPDAQPIKRPCLHSPALLGAILDHTGKVQIIAGGISRTISHEIVAKS